MASIAPVTCCLGMPPPVTPAADRSRPRQPTGSPQPVARIGSQRRPPKWATSSPLLASACPATAIGSPRAHARGFPQPVTNTPRGWSGLLPPAGDAGASPARDETPSVPAPRPHDARLPASPRTRFLPVTPWFAPSGDVAARYRSLPCRSTPATGFESSRQSIDLGHHAGCHDRAEARPRPPSWPPIPAVGLPAVPHLAHRAEARRLRRVLAHKSVLPPRLLRSPCRFRAEARPPLDSPATVPAGSAPSPRPVTPLDRSPAELPDRTSRSAGLSTAVVVRRVATEPKPVRRRCFAPPLRQATHHSARESLSRRSATPSRVLPGAPAQPLDRSSPAVPGTEVHGPPGPSRPLRQVTRRLPARCPSTPKCDRAASVLLARRFHALDPPSSPPPVPKRLRRSGQWSLPRATRPARPCPPVRRSAWPSPGPLSSPTPRSRPSGPRPLVGPKPARQSVRGWLLRWTMDQLAPLRHQAEARSCSWVRSFIGLANRWSSDQPGPATSPAVARPARGPKPLCRLAGSGRFQWRYGSSRPPHGSIRRSCRGAGPGCRTDRAGPGCLAVRGHWGRSPAVPSGSASVLVGNEAFRRRHAPLPKHRGSPPVSCPAGRG
jgi:hypothetical protein